MVTTASIVEIIRGIIKDLQKSNGRDAFQYQGDNEFSLSENYISSEGMKVFQNGTELDEDDWSYNEDTNIVTIEFVFSGNSLVNGDDILIKYNYYEKYSDSEITSFIKSNLPRFVIRRYKKTFYMNSEDEIVTSNGENPTEEEGNVIAAITAIDIDPQNINIKIGNDFTISATENKSKTELINEALSHFLRSFGKLDYLEEEE